MMFPNRKEFLVLSGGAALGWFLGPYFTWKRSDASSESSLPEKRICRLSDLKLGRPVCFSYLHEDLGTNFIVKLGVEASGGIAYSKDIVAFNAMNLSVPESLHEKRYLIGGPSSRSSTYNLSRSGEVHSGPATISLPQLLLIVKGQEVYAQGFRVRKNDLPLDFTTLPS